MIPKIENFGTLSKLALETATFVGKKQRDRYYYIVNKFISKYEQLYPAVSSSAQKAHPSNSKAERKPLSAD
jgi:hypothetical protein